MTGTLNYTALSVHTGGTTLAVNVGANGNTGGAGGGGSGGGSGPTGGGGGGGGGGASKITNGTFVDLVAGGGGGEGGSGNTRTAVKGGNAGYPTGSTGNRTSSSDSGTPGGGGTQTSGGGGGGGGTVTSCGSGTPGAAGTFAGGGAATGSGGNGGSGTYKAGGGGGGGGGYSGGGGGGGGGGGFGFGCTTYAGGGGGGGSGYVRSTIGSFTESTTPTAPEVVIRWKLVNTSTTLSVTTPAGTVQAGSTVKVTADVKYTTGLSGTPVGTVTFTRGIVPSSATTPTSIETPTNACTKVPVTSGKAVCSFTVPYAAGTEMGIRASYGGDGGGRPSTSKAVGRTVLGDPTTTSTPTITTTGAGLKLLSTVTPESYARTALTGKVTFQVHNTASTTWSTACSQTLPSGLTPGKAGQVTCKFTSLTPGFKYYFRAQFPGSSTNLASTSGTSTYSVAQAATSSSVTANGTSFPFGGLVTLSVQVTGIPSGDPTPGTITYESAGGTKLSCLRSGQQNPAAVSASTGKATNCTFKPTRVTASFKVEVRYSGGKETLGSTATTAFTVAKQAPKVTLQVASKNRTTSVGEPIDLTASLAETGVSTSSPTYVTPQVPVEFFDGTTPIAGCTSVTASNGTATCASAPTPTTAGTTDYHATACPTGGASACADWATSKSAVVAYTAAKAVSEVSLTPSGTAATPAPVQGGHTTTVTATISFTAGSAPTTGKVTFLETGNAVATASASCATVTVATGKAACTFKPTPGGASTISATYTPSNPNITTPVPAASTHLSAKGLITSAKLLVSGPGIAQPTSGGTISYGVPDVATVTVKSPTNPGTTGLTTGEVTVRVAGTTVCATLSLATGSATCTLKALPAGTGVALSAAYHDATKRYANSTATDTFSVRAAPTAVTLALSTSSGHLQLTATVKNTATGATAPPSGTLDFKAGTSTIATCGAVPVHTAAGADAAATCTAAIPTTSTTYTAAFTATTAKEFQASTSPSENFNPGAKCSTTYATLWGDQGKAFTFSVGTFGSTLDAIKVDLASVSGGCRSVFPITFTNASLSILGGTVTQTTPLTGYVEDATGATDPTVCFTGGTLSLPTSWGLKTLVLSATAKLCFLVTSASGTTGSVGKITSGTFSTTGITLPFGSPSSSVTYKMTVSFTTTPVPAMTVALAPSSATTSVYVTAAITVSDKSKAVTATGVVSLDNVAFGKLQGTFSVSAGKSGSIGGTVKFAAIDTTSPYSPILGLSFKHVSVTLSSSSSPNLAVSATALVGSGTDPVNLSVTGSYAKPAWTLSVAVTRSTSWQPFASLSFPKLTLKGTIVVSPSGDSFDLEMGAPPTKAAPGTPVVAWNPLTGLTVKLDCIAFAYGIDPVCGHAATTKAVAPADPTLYTEGSLSIGGAGGITAGFSGSVDLKSGALSLSLDGTVATVKVAPATGVTLTLESLKVTGQVGSGLSVSGSASATIPALGVAHLTVSVTDQSGALTILVANIALTPIGIPLTGDVAYASQTVPRYNLTGYGRVTLHQGYNGFAKYMPGSSVKTVLSTIGFSLPAGGVITFEGAWAPGSAPTFTASLNPPSGSVPFLTLPGGATLTGATLEYGNHKLLADLTGTIPVPGAAAAAVSMTLTLGPTGTFAGTAKITHIVVLGQTITLAGTLARSKSGTLTGNVKATIPGPFTPFAGVPLTLSGVTISAGTAGLGVAGTASIDGLGTLTLSGSLTSLSNWTLSVKASAAHSWTPITGVTLSPTFTGTLADSNGKVTYVLGASGIGSTPLLKLTIGDVSVSVDHVTLGNGTAPTGCKIEHKGDLWLAMSGSLGLAFGGVTGTVSVVGCVDITAKALDLSATFTNFSFSALGTDVKLTKPVVTFSYSPSAGVAVSVSAPITITMPTGGTLSITAVLAPEKSGFVIGAAANLSSWLGSDGDAGHIYYASTKVSNFTTGTSTLGSITLTQGIDFAIAFTLPTSVISALNDVHISLPAHTGLAAIGTANFVTKTYSLRVSVSLGATGLELFTAGGTSLSLKSGFFEVAVSPDNAHFSVGLSAMLHIPAPTSGYSASTVPMTGELTIAATGVTVSLSLGNCTGSTVGWVNAFGITGLNVKCAGIQGGISDEFPFVDVGFNGTITHLPTLIATTIGYVNGTPITFAFNLDPFLLSLAIGKTTSTTVALEPLKAFGQGTLMQVDHASLYVSPSGATIGPTTYPAGFGLSFLATIVKVKVNVMAKIGISPPSITFTASVSRIVFSVLSIGPVAVFLHASTSPASFTFRLKGTATLGPASATLGDFLRVGGKLTATVTVAVGSAGFKAFLSGTIDVSVTVNVPTSVCWAAFIPYPCTWQWEGTSVTIHIGRTGFSATGTGVTLEADTYSITFHYDGGVSVSDAVAGLTSPKVLVTGQVAPATVTRHSGPVTPLYALSVHPSGATPVGSWSTTGSMHTGRAFPAVATLQDGDVLVAGGANGNGTSLASAEVYNPATKTWSATSTLPVAATGATATVLGDGEVLVAGGLGRGDTALTTAELYDPATGLFTRTGSLETGRADAAAALLADGDVLIAGGTGAGHAPLATAEIYDPTTGSFSAATSLPGPRSFAASTTLADGHVLLAGGLGASSLLATAVTYDPTTGVWAAAGTMSQARIFATAELLADGDVLVVGDGATGDLYDPATNSWKATGGMAATRSMPAVAELPDGDVLVAGGVADGTVLATAEVYLAGTGTWESAGTMPSARMGSFVSVLSNGQVLVGGGMASTGGTPVTSVDLYSLPNKTTPTKKTTTKTTTTKTVPTGTTPPAPPASPPVVVTPTTPASTVLPIQPTSSSFFPTKGTTTTEASSTSTCASPRLTPPTQPAPPGSVRDAMATMANGKGYWLASATGGVFACKHAQFYGSPTGLRVPVTNIVGIAAGLHGKGYWLASATGGVFAFGDSEYLGSLPALGVSVHDIVGITATPDGKGYWLVASDGGVFAFGDAGFYGSMGGKPLNKPIVAMTPTPDGKGYWLVASDGGVFAFGDAQFYGSTGSLTLNKPIVSMTPRPTGHGYWLVASDGGVFAFSAPSYGSTGANPPPVPVLGLVTTPTGLGYSVVDEAGASFNFGA